MYYIVGELIMLVAAYLLSQEYTHTLDGALVYPQGGKVRVPVVESPEVGRTNKTTHERAPP